MDNAADHSNTCYGDLVFYFSAQCTAIVIAMIWKLRLAKVLHTIAHTAS